MRHENISTGLWADPDFDTCSNPDTLTLYVYLFSNAHGHGLTGIYLMPAERTIRCETRLAPARYRRALDDLVTRGKVVLHGEWVWVVGKGNHSLYGPNQARGALTHLADVPCELAAQFVAKYADKLRSFGVGKIPDFGTVPNGSGTVPKGFGITDTVYGTGSDTGSGSGPEPFPTPSSLELSKYQEHLESKGVHWTAKMLSYIDRPFVAGMKAALPVSKGILPKPTETPWAFCDRLLKAWATWCETVRDTRKAGQGEHPQFKADLARLGDPDAKGE